MSGIFVDSNLLVLLSIGRTDPKLIEKHRRSQSFDCKDYQLLIDIVSRYSHVLVTPNTLTEASNLLGQHREPERSRLYRQLQYLIQDSREIVVSSETASNNRYFERLGLTDAALLEAATRKCPLLTVDLELYFEANRNGVVRAMNFTHLRGL